MFGEWRGAVVDPDGERPDPESFESVEVPGRPARFAGAEAVAYRTTFDDPRSAEDERATVVLRGVYAHARVWVNGQKIADHDAYFEPLRVDLGDELQAENELLIECRRPDDRFGGSYETDGVPAELAVPGIWWGTDIECYAGHRIVDLTAQPTVDADSARFEVRTTVRATSALDDRLTFSVKPEGSRRGRGMMNRAPVTAGAGEQTTVEHTIEIRDPALWWPHDLGDQPRYVVRAKLDDDERTLTTGLCDVSYDDSGITVNGQSVGGRGVNLLDAEPNDIERAVELNANLVRLRAHAPAPAVYEAADEAGVLVWQDLPLTGSGSFDVERGQELLERLVGVHQHHPSLATIGVHDSPTTLGDGDLGSGVLDRLRLRWRMWRADYDRTDAETVAEVVPADIVAVPVIGPPGIDADASVLYPGWKYGEAEDIEWLLDRYPEVGDLVAAFGAGALGSAGEDEIEGVAGFDAATHERHVEGDRKASRDYQRRVVRTVAERLRLADTDALLAAALRDLDGAGMGVLTDDGQPKPAREALATAFEPVQAFCVGPSAGEEATVVVCNDTPQAASGRLHWEAGEASGDIGISVEGTSQETVETQALPDEAETLELSLSLDEQTVTNGYEL